jgi:hypothetical protein
MEAEVEMVEPEMAGFGTKVAGTAGAETEAGMLAQQVVEQRRAVVVAALETELWPR